MRVGLFRELAIGEWEQCTNFLETMESLLVEADHSWQHRMDEESPDVDEDYRAEFEEIRDEYSQELCEFKVILTNSSFVYSYSLFEHRMVRMCKRLEKKHNLPSSIECIRDSSVTNSIKKYIRQYYGEELFRRAKEWGEIQTYRKIRNQIVHREGIIHDDDCNCDSVENIIHHAGNARKKCKYLIKYANGKGLLASTDKNPHLELKRPFCEEAIGTFKQFMVKVWRAEPI